MFRNGVFISYSHEDKRWLDSFVTALKPYSREEKIKVWSDRDIAPGSDWAREIGAAIDNSRVAVLLVTPNLLASDYIMEKELPLILEKNSKGDLVVFWIAVSYSSYDLTPLVQLQAANDPNLPLDQLSTADRNKELTLIAQKLAKAMDINAIGNVLKIIDDFVPGQKAFIDGVPPDDRERNYSRQAQQEKNMIEIKDRGNYVMETITADDLERLDKNSRMLIRTYEYTMKMLFERWVELQPKSYARDPEVREDAKDEMAGVRKDLCEQLNAILDYLHSLHKNLDDHYYHVRHLCSM